MTPTATPGQQQHVQLHRKWLMRRHLLRWAVDGAAYVPFIGDGDLAALLYADREILGADLDPRRVETARARLPGAEIIEADCDGWPFAGYSRLDVAVADFDAYVDPYAGFRAFWQEAPRRSRLVLFFTDGRRQGMMRTGSWTLPDGSHRTIPPPEKMAIFSAYLSRHVWPWFENFIAPWQVVDRFRYLRSMMVYWGAVIER